MLPGGVANDLMGGKTPSAVPGSCSSIAAGDTCLIIVTVRAGHPLTAKRRIVSGFGFALPVMGTSGSSDVVLIGYRDHHSGIYTLDLAHDASSATRLFSLPSVLPLAFGAQGATFFYLVGHGPEALWSARVTPHGFKEAHVLNANVDLSALAG